MLDCFSLFGIYQRPGTTRSIPTAEASGQSSLNNTMSGFEDDFGEMAAGGGGGGGEGEDIPDPALDFLAREQEQLGELETELAPLTGRESLEL